MPCYLLNIAQRNYSSDFSQCTLEATQEVDLPFECLPKSRLVCFNLLFDSILAHPPLMCVCVSVSVLLQNGSEAAWHTERPVYRSVWRSGSGSEFVYRCYLILINSNSTHEHFLAGGMEKRELSAYRV